MMPLYEDNHLLALDKPPGIPTQGEQGLEGLAKAYVKEKFEKSGAVFLEAAHRLDQRVQGICLFARTSKALSRLHASQREGLWKKTYLARVEKEPEPSEGVLIDYLRHGSGRAEIDASGSRGGKRSELVYRLIGASLLEIDLVTGRYHQIRAQLSHAGMPIVGDVKYGAKRAPGPGIYLKQVRLVIPHPIGARPLVIEATREFE